MSVLSELSQRLKTDLADTARASIDPIFSRQLTEANFRDKAFEKEKRAAIEEAATLREQQLADNELKVRRGIHMKLVEDGISAVKEQGNSGPLIRILSAEGLDPAAREWAVRTANAHLPQGYEGIEREAKIKNIKNQMEVRDKRFLLDKQKVDNQVEQALQDDLREDEKFAYNKAVDMMNQQQSVINRDSYLNHIEENAFMFSEEELEAARDTFQFGDEATVKEYWNNLWKRVFTRNAEAGKDRRSKDRIKEGMAPSAITGPEFREASMMLQTEMQKDIESDDRMKKLLDPGWVDILFTGSTQDSGKENTQSLLFQSARIAKSFARDVQKGASEDELFAAYQLAKNVGIETVDGEPRINGAKVTAFAKRITDSGYTIDLVVQLADKQNKSISQVMADLDIP